MVAITGIIRSYPISTSGRFSHSTRCGARVYGLCGTPSNRHPSLVEFNGSPRCRGTNHSGICNSFASRRRIQRRRQRQRSDYLADRLTQAGRRCRGGVTAVARVNCCHQPPTRRRVDHSAMRVASADGSRSTAGDRNPSLPEFNCPRCRCGIGRSSVRHRFVRRRIQRRRQRHRSRRLLTSHLILIPTLARRDGLRQGGRRRGKVAAVPAVDRGDRVSPVVA